MCHDTKTLKTFINQTFQLLTALLDSQLILDTALYAVFNQHKVNVSWAFIPQQFVNVLSQLFMLVN